jgi:glycosyltransferase involved in cell wall biosynthesis
VDRLSTGTSIWPKDSPLARVTVVGLAIFSGLLFIPAFLNQLYTLLRGRGSSAHRDLAAEELLKAFEAIKLGHGDLIIFQTMLWPTFESLLELRVQAIRPYDCDAFFIAHEDWLIYNSLFVRFAPARFRKRVLESLPFKRAKLVCTNQPLSDFCAQWSGYRPPLVKELAYSASDMPKRVEASGGQLNILVPGVYRGDKNFEMLGVLIDQVLGKYPNARFCLHESVLARISLSTRLGASCTVYKNIAEAREWLAFLASHSIILIPYGEAYRHRISGIIHEARLLNIPVVCSAAIADASLLAEQGYLFGDDGSGVGEAVEFCLQAGPAAGHFIEEYPPSLLQLVEEDDGWVDSRNKLVAVQVKPAWTRCGTTVVLEAQLDMLVERDFFVVEIYLKADPWLATTEQVEFMWQVMRGGREYCGGMVCRVLLKQVKLLPLLAYIRQLYGHKFQAFQQRENIHHSWCVPDAALSRFMANQGVELALVNHMFNSDFARRYIPAKHFVCESHDIQINQLLLRRPDLLGNYEVELDYELDVLAKYDAVVNLNGAEHQLIKGRIGDSSFFIHPPIVDRGVVKLYACLADLIAQESSYIADEPLPEAFDLLIVGDSHPSNIESVNQFITRVFTRLPAGTTLGVVGRVAGFLDEESARLPHVYKIGFVEDLANVYDFARLVVLPDISGEGIAIKAFDPIAKGQAFVATAIAMRGFAAAQLSELRPWVCDDLDSMTDKISGLLADANGVADFQKRCERVTAEFGMPKYIENWERVLDDCASRAAADQG